MARRPVHHLEDLLRSWEDLCLLQQTALLCNEARGEPTQGHSTGGFANWQKLRSDILQRKVFQEQEYGLPPVQANKLGMTATIPFFVWAWSYWSRRVFRVSRDLQATLLATSVQSITYADLVLPFPAFLIELEHPLMNEHGQAIDAILVLSGAPSQPLEVNTTLVIIPLLAQVDPRIKLNDLDRQKLIQLRANGRWDDVAKLHTRLTPTFWHEPIQGLVIDRQEYSGHSILTPLRQVIGPCLCGKTHENTDEFALRLIHLVAGLCFTLKMRPPGQSPHTSTWSPLSKTARIDHRAITNQADICTVDSDQKLSAQDLALLESVLVSGADDQPAIATGREMRAHFRRGYWRRRPGQGHDPNALKVVEVRFTIVRGDRLRENAIPAGNQTTT